MADPLAPAIRGDQSWFTKVRTGSLSVRLAATGNDVDAVQALRYRVFYDEMAARPTADMLALRRDFDAFDDVCDHLIVTDHDLGGGAGTVVGTYRLLRGASARQHGRFYTAGEYDISNLIAYGGELMELGRSCVDSSYRTRPTMQLLWQGIAQYVFHYDITLMFGCASLPGTDPGCLSMPLSYLHHYCLAPPALRPRALPALYVDMNRLPLEQVEHKIALAALPPLIKGYIRLGGFVGDGAVVDRQFNTTDVCVIVKTDLVTERYVRHYERRAREPVPDALPVDARP